MSPDDERNEMSSGRKSRFAETSWAIIGGAVTTLFAVGVMVLMGQVGDYEARLLLESTVPTIRFLSSAVMTASSTILALMLTMLALSADAEAELTGAHYQQIQQVSLMAVVALIASVAVLMILTFPLEESEELASFYDLIYYTVMGASAVLGGMMVALVLMLLNAIRELVQLFHPSGSSRLTRDSH